MADNVRPMMGRIVRKINIGVISLIILCVSIILMLINWFLASLPLHTLDLILDGRRYDVLNSMQFSIIPKSILLGSIVSLIGWGYENKKSRICFFINLFLAAIWICSSFIIATLQ